MADNRKAILRRFVHLYNYHIPQELAPQNAPPDAQTSVLTTTSSFQKNPRNHRGLGS